MTQSLPIEDHTAAPGVDYYTPLTTPAPGTLLPEATKKHGGDATIHLFQPLTIRGVEFKNRIWASPMCMYSSDDGHATDFHLVHLGGMATRGIGAIIVEATAVVPEGRITPDDAGIWQDSQIAPMKRIVDFVHSQGTKIGVQLAHAGRKSSTLPPWIEKGTDGSEHPTARGWKDNVQSASGIIHSDNCAFWTPKESSLEYIQSIVDAFKDAAVRSKKIGYDFLEIHGAHGYYLHQFLSPLSNKRPSSDPYSGSTLATRAALAFEIVKAIRSVWDGPLFFRVSASDWADNDVGSEAEKDGIWNQWGIKQTSWLTGELAKLGVDLVDTSSGGVWSKQNIDVGPLYQVPFAAQLKKENPSIAIGAVGLITTPTQAESVIREGKADVVLLARELLRDLDFPLNAATELGVCVQPIHQYERAHTRMFKPASAIKN